MYVIETESNNVTVKAFDTFELANHWLKYQASLSKYNISSPEKGERWVWTDKDGWKRS